MQPDRTISRSRWYAALLVAAGVGAACGQQVLQFGAAARPSSAPSGEALSGNLFKQAPPEWRQGMRLARDAVRAENYGTAIKVLQEFIDQPDDYFFYEDIDKKRKVLSYKSEAMRLIASLPEKGRQIYELKYGLKAKQDLKDALASGDFKTIEGIARHYPSTDAGYQATYLLAAHEMERGNALTAAMHFERLRHAKRDGLRQQFEPMLSLRTAVSWGRAGMPEAAVRTLVEFRRLNGGAPIVLGGKKFALFDRDEDALPWLVRTLGSQHSFAGLGKEQWTMFRGNPSRTASSSPASPVWDTQWTIDPLRELKRESEDAAAFEGIPGEVRKLRKERGEQHALMMPAGHPLIVGNVVIFRTLLDVWGVDARTGEMLWRGFGRDDSLLQETGLQTKTQPSYGRIRRNNNVRWSSLELLLDQRLWRDLNAGTLSSDGETVFVVEDPGFYDARTIRYDPRTGRGMATMKPNNHLTLYDVKSGKLRSRLGGSEMPERETDGLKLLAGHYFLGPPLPLGDRYFCLADYRGEIWLIAFGLRKEPLPSGDFVLHPRVLWKQSLVTPTDGVESFPLRRMAGLTPSYAGGVLICPTTAGTVVAVDPARRLLLWGYRYPVNTDDNQSSPRNRYNTVHTNPYDAESRWLDAAVTVADGRVILTPRDSNELHCLNLVDGNLLWKKSRGPMLYVAGVHEGKLIMVGKTQVEALRLDDGKPAWKQATPIPAPSGRGFQTGKFYHVPLSSREIATIDLTDGRLLARAKTRLGIVPGNLISANGTVVSQSVDRVMGFKPLDELVSEVDARIKANPRDAEALAIRGEMRLRNGDEAAGLEDLRASVRIRPTERAKSLVASVLLEGLRLDFPRFRKYAPDLERLLTDPRQQERFHRLLAAGLHEVGEHQAAFREYLKLAGIDTGGWKQERVSGELTVRNDRWLRTQLAEVYDKASTAERKRLDQEVQKQFAAATKATGPSPLRRFVRAFGKLPAADPARRLLADRLDETGNALELEFLLDDLRNSPDRAYAAFATARLAKLFVANKRFDAGAVLLAELKTKFAAQATLDGLTGRQFAGKLRSAHPELGHAETDAAPWPKRRFQAGTKDTRQGNPSRSYAVAFEGARGPYFRNWSFTMLGRTLRAHDARGDKAWQVPVGGTTGFAGYYGNSVHVRGHLVVVEMSNQFAVIDALSEDAKLLWQRNLYEKQYGRNVNGRVAVQRVLVGGRIRMVVNGPNGAPLGQLGPVSSDMIVYQVGKFIYAADPITGDVLWKRSWPERGSRLFGDDRYVFVVSPGATTATVLRASDGFELGSRPVSSKAALKATRGRNELRLELSGQTAVLSYVDVWGRKILWQKHFQPDAKLQLVEGDEIAVIEPKKGRLHVLSLDGGQSRVNVAIESDPMLQSFSVRRSASRYVVLSYSPDNNNPNLARFNSLNPYSPLVNGAVYGIDRKTGKKIWAAWVESQSYDDSQPNELPVLIMAARHYEQLRQAGRFRVRYRTLIRVLDVRNGALVLKDELASSNANYAWTVRRPQHEIEVHFYRKIATLRLVKDEPLGKPTTKLQRPKPAKKKKDDKKKAAAPPANGAPAAPRIIIRQRGIKQ